MAYVKSVGFLSVLVRGVNLNLGLLSCEDKLIEHYFNSPLDHIFIYGKFG